MTRLPRMMMVCLALTGLAACNANERGRQPHFDKGVYMGRSDEVLAPATVLALSSRVEMQRTTVGLDQALAPAQLPQAGANVPVTGREAGQRF